MHVSAKLRLATTSALLAGAAIGIGIIVMHTRPAALAAAPRRQSTPIIVPTAVEPSCSASFAATGASAIPQNAPCPQSLASVSATLASLATPAPLPPPSAAIRRVLPSVVETVSDWRLFAPERLTVEAVPGAPIEFECVELKRGGPNGEFTIWVGRNAGIPGASFVGVGARDRWIGTQIVPGAHEYLLAVSGSEATVIERPDAYCSTPLSAPAPQPTPHPVAMAVSSASAALTTDTSTLSVDVVFFYGDDVASGLAGIIGGNGTVADFAAFVATSSIEQVNQMLVQSGVTNYRWRLAGTERVPAYTKKTTMEEELQSFRNTTAEPGKSVATRMTEIGADQGVFWIWDERSDFETVGGIAETPGQACVVYVNSHDILLAHELAHNFGCRHDRQTSDERNEGARNGDGRYCYGHRFTRDGVDCGTIMSYARNRIPYYSNPDISVGADVYSTGWTGTLSTGLAASDPRGADNARWLREHAVSMATNRELVTAPVITVQPTGTTITAGQTLTLSVSATGGNLTYQWKKDGADLVGATTATYTKYSTTSTDSGRYAVAVRNNLGTITSTEATVTINAAPAPAPSSSSSSGGGGALPAWFALALAFVGIVHGLSRSRSDG